MNHFHDLYNRNCALRYIGGICDLWKLDVWVFEDNLISKLFYVVCIKKVLKKLQRPLLDFLPIKLEFHESFEWDQFFCLLLESGLYLSAWGRTHCKKLSIKQYINPEMFQSNMFRQGFYIKSLVSVNLISVEKVSVRFCKIRSTSVKIQVYFCKIFRFTYI